MNSIDIKDLIYDNMLAYSKEVITNRALIDSRDGLKPGQRSWLTAMYRMKAFNNVKSADIMGTAMSIYPHGSLYEVGVNMVLTDGNNYPLIIGKGSFGNHTSSEMQASADRYTEMRLDPVAIEIFNTIKTGNVNMIDNYNETIKIPEIIPFDFPAPLCYANEGIAVGYKSTTPSYNILEVLQATQDVLMKNEFEPLYPDYATGGFIFKDDKAVKIFNQGIDGDKGAKLTVRGKAQIVGNDIEITEIPYTTTREAIINKIIQLAESNKIKGITDVVDSTGVKGQKIVVECRKTADKELILQQLYNSTPLQKSVISYSYMIHNGLPKIMSVRDSIDTFIEFRTSTLKKELQYTFDQKSAKLELLLDYKKIVDKLDEVIEIIRNAESDEVIEKLLVETFNVTQESAQLIANMKLRKINKKSLIQQMNEIDKLKQETEELKNKLSDMKTTLYNDLERVKERFKNCTRKTIIIDKPDEIVIKPIKQETKSVDNESEYKITATKLGYVFKTSVNNSSIKMRADDEIVEEKIMKNSDYIVFVLDNTTGLRVKIKDVKKDTPYYAMKDINENIIGTLLVTQEDKFVVVMFEDKILKYDARNLDGNNSIIKNCYTKRLSPINFKIFKTDQVYNNIDLSKLEIKLNRDGTGVKIQKSMLVK